MMTAIPSDQSAQVVLFLEDPGAYFYLQDLPAAVSAMNVELQIIADGFAATALRDAGTPFIEAGSRNPVSFDRTQLMIAGTSENSESCAFELFRIAREQQIPTLGIVDGTQYPEYRFRGQSSVPLQHAPDWITVPDTITRQSFIELGADADRVLACGHPGLDQARQYMRHRSRERLGLASSNEPRVPRLVYIGEPNERFTNTSLAYEDVNVFRAKNGSADRITAIMASFLDVIDELEIETHTTLRLHPKSAARDFDPHSARFDSISSGGNPYEVLANADVVVGISSSLLPAAAVMGIPNISMLATHDQERMLPTIVSGHTRLAHNPKELGRLLTETLAKRNADTSDDNLAQLFPPESLARLVSLIDQIMLDSPIKAKEAR